MGNHARLFDAARLNVGAWEKANVNERCHYTALVGVSAIQG